jgi:hypothetical protein
MLPNSRMRRSIDGILDTMDWLHRLMLGRGSVYFILSEADSLVYWLEKIQFWVPGVHIPSAGLVGAVDVPSSISFPFSCCRLTDLVTLCRVCLSPLPARRASITIGRGLSVLGFSEIVNRPISTLISLHQPTPLVHHTLPNPLPPSFAGTHTH